MTDRKYQKLRSAVCNAYGAACFSNQCPLRKYRCYALSNWNNITPLTRKKMEKIIDAEVERLGLDVEL